MDEERRINTNVNEGGPASEKWMSMARELITATALHYDLEGKDPEYRVSVSRIMEDIIPPGVAVEQSVLDGLATLATATALYAASFANEAANPDGEDDFWDPEGREQVARWLREFFEERAEIE